MKLTEFKALFFKKLISKIEKNELDEYFFWLIDFHCGLNRMEYILNPNFYNILCDS